VSLVSKGPVESISTIEQIIPTGKRKKKTGNAYNSDCWKDIFYHVSKTLEITPLKPKAEEGYMRYTLPELNVCYDWVRRLIDAFLLSAARNPNRGNRR
jgi:hypothetical protein